MKPHRILPLATAIVFALPAWAKDAASIKAPLAPGSDSDGSGLAVATFRSKKSDFVVTVRKLDPSKSYSVEVNSIIEGTLTTDRGGRGTARFATPARRNVGLLDFDPRGKTLRILDGNTAALQGIVSGSGEASGTVVDERVELTAQAAAPARSNAKARFTTDAKGRRILRVEISGVTGGPFNVLVGGTSRGQLTIRGRAGSLTLVDPVRRASELLLDFDPRGQVVEITNGADVLFAGELRAKARGVNMASPSLNRVNFPAVNASRGIAYGKLRIDQRARRHFSVEVEGVAPGTYSVLIDNVANALGNIVVPAGATEGELEFTTGDDDPGELPLTFDPVGRTFSVVQGQSVLFRGVFSPNLSGTGTPSGGAASLIEEQLASTGAIAGASGDAKYKVDNDGDHSFSVEIEDVPVGSYTLTVGGVVRGTIRVVAVAGGTGGELEFEAEREPGKLLLNFDPRGQTIEVSNATGTIIFSHLLGNGSAAGGTGGGGSGQVTPYEVVLPLLNQGLDGDATAEAELQRDETGEFSFEVEAEDLPAGVYVLKIGAKVSSITLASDGKGGTRGKAKFETTPKAGQQPLDFTVIGQLIEISQNGSVFFSRTFPTP